MRIEAIAIHQFAPFGPQICEFGNPGDEGNRDVHIFVGENGTGKTRLLSLMMAACGNTKELDDRSTSPVKAMVVASNEGVLKPFWLRESNALYSSADRIVSLFEEYPSKGNINGPFAHSASHLLEQENDTAAMAFRSVAAIRDEKLKPMGAVDWGNQQDMLAFTRTAKDSTALCQALANMKIRAGMYLASNPVERVNRIIQMIERIEKTLEYITGRSFIFIVEQDGADVYLKVIWGDVKMRLHQLPDGLRAIIGWLAACVARLDLLLPNAANPLVQPIILFIDEPETHLHPAWQRKIIPSLKKLLPKSQIFVATHSPFVVSSVNDGWIYVLKAGDGGTVQIHGPKECSKGDTYIDAVEDALGLKEWYDPETEAMLAKFRTLRDTALKTFAESDKNSMVHLATEIAKRSESLEVMMGQELAQFNRKEKSANP